MANYNGTSRTNYFRVKDQAKFHAWAESLDLTVEEKGGSFALFPGDYADDGAFPSCVNDPESEADGEELDFMLELSKHLADRSVAVRISAGAEKLRYVSGFADAINNRGERVSIHLDEIYELAASLGTEISLAEY